MHIAIAFDENYLTPVYVLLASLFENNQGESITVHAIATGISSIQQNELKQYVLNYTSTICFYSLGDDFANDFAIPATLWWTPAVYYRIMFPALLPDYVDKFVYLDTDIVVVGKLRKLYNTVVNDHPIAAVCDFVDSRPDLGINEPNSYFNSGVLLVNKDKWIQKDITGKCIEFIKNNPEKLIYVDQDALNAVLVNDWQKLDSRFNSMFKENSSNISMKQLRSALKDIVIVHFTTQHKPWSVLGENRLRYLYFKYFEKIPKKYRVRYNDFLWNRHRIRKFLEIRLGEVLAEYPTLNGLWRKK
ncbi:glycosyltransferase family 8 protein [Hymenobacter elongatus]|nr:glycosyltransferase family 8 protein [Hymenobacter elongatus]